MRYFLNQGIGLRNRQPNRLPDRVPGTGRLRISIIQRRRAQEGERVHSRNSLDVAESVLQRNLAGVDEWQSGRTEAEGDFAPGTFDFQPVMCERPAV